MMTSTETGELAKAMAKAQFEMRNPKFDAQNPHFRNKFASLAAIRDAVIPLFSKHGIAVSQELASTAGGIACTTVLMHESGQWAAFGPLCMPSSKDDAQGRGSAATYAKRYSLQSVAGVVGDEDDDGEGAQARSTNPADHDTRVSPKQAKFAAEFADSFRAALAADIEEAERAAQILAIREECNEDKIVFTEAWKLLGAKERSAIKSYIAIAQGRAA